MLVFSSTSVCRARAVETLKEHIICNFTQHIHIKVCYAWHTFTGDTLALIFCINYIIARLRKLKLVVHRIFYSKIQLQKKTAYLITHTHTQKNLLLSTTSPLNHRVNTDQTLQVCSFGFFLQELRSRLIAEYRRKS